MKIVIENLTDGDIVPGGVLLIRGRLSPSHVREKLYIDKLNKFVRVSIAGKRSRPRRAENPVGTQIRTSTT